MSLRRLSLVPPQAGAYTPMGSLSQWITVLAPSARNSDGSSQPPATFASTWASVRALQGAELDKAQQIAQEVSHLVEIFYQVGITEAMQVMTADSRTFQIKWIEDPNERHERLYIFCAEIGQNAGQQS